MLYKCLKQDSYKSKVHRNPLSEQIKKILRNNQIEFQKGFQTELSD